MLEIIIIIGIALILTWIITRLIIWSMIISELGYSGLMKQWVCKHDWRDYGFSSVECKNCYKVEDNPELCAELRNKFILGMVEAGHWDKDEVNRGLSKRGL